MGTSIFALGRIVAAALLSLSFAANAAQSIPGEYLVQLKESRSLLSPDQLSRALNAEVVEMVRKDLALIRQEKICRGIRKGSSTN